MGWRGSFLAVVALGLIVLVAIAVFVPPVPAPAAPAAAQLRHALASRVLAVLGLAALMFAGQYAALTYIGPFLAERTGVSGELVSAFLLAYGAATAVGAFAGGRFADHRAALTILVGNAVLVFAIAALALVGDVPALVVVTLLAWGVVGIGLVPSVQFRVVTLAGPGRDVAATLPASAINVGIAAGSLVGGRVVTAHGATGPAVAGVALLLLALPLAWWTRRLAPASEATGSAVDSAPDLAA
jgi:DHA1 family inner membrane transport protein